MIFPWYIKYPNQNDEILNLDWILSTIDNLVNEVSNFVTLNTIKYADPIQWNITTQYEKNTVVIDPISGSAYISTKPVPAGVGLNNTDYWNIIFTLDVISANKNITLRDDANNILATFESEADDWLLWQGTLYIVTRSIEVGQSYVVGYNIDRYTVEMYLKSYIYNVVTTIGSLTDLTTTDKTSIVAALNELKDAIDTNTDDITNISTDVGDLDDLTTTDKASLVAAINEVLSTLNSSIGDLDDLDTTDKSSVVDAINELVGDITGLKEAKNIYELVSNMVADTSLAAGDIVATLGYHDAGIGGAIYTISSTAGTAAISLNNGLYANIAINDEIHLSQLGARENDDISTLLVTALTLINRNGIVYLDDNYNIDNAVNIIVGERDNFTIDGKEHNLTYSNNNSVINFTVSGNFDRGVNIINCDFYGNDNNDALTFNGFMSAVNRHEIKNCQFWGFRHSIYINKSRMFLIDNVAIWSIPDDGEGISLVALNNNDFVGDMEITNCQFSSKNGNNGNSKEILLNLVSGATAAGIIMDGIDFYPCGRCFSNSGNGEINDVWLINSQFDNTSTHSIYLEGSGDINNLHIENNYDTAPLDFITIYKPSATCKSVFITENYVNGFGSSTDPCINFNSGNRSSISVKNNHFINCTNSAGAIVAIFNARSAEAIGNIFDMDSGYYTNGLITISDCINAICTNNIGMGAAGFTYRDNNNTNKVFAQNIPT